MPEPDVAPEPAASNIDPSQWTSVYGKKLGEPGYNEALKRSQKAVEEQNVLPALPEVPDIIPQQPKQPDLSRLYSGSSPVSKSAGVADLSRTYGGGENINVQPEITQPKLWTSSFGVRQGEPEYKKAVDASQTLLNIEPYKAGNKGYNLDDVLKDNAATPEQLVNAGFKKEDINYAQELLAKKAVGHDYFAENPDLVSMPPPPFQDFLHDYVKTNPPTSEQFKPIGINIGPYGTREAAEQHFSTSRGGLPDTGAYSDWYKEAQDLYVANYGKENLAKSSGISLASEAGFPVARGLEPSVGWQGVTTGEKIWTGVSVATLAAPYAAKGISSLVGKGGQLISKEAPLVRGRSSWTGLSEPRPAKVIGTTPKGELLYEGGEVPMTPARYGGPSGTPPSEEVIGMVPTGETLSIPQKPITIISEEAVPLRPGQPRGGLAVLEETKTEIPVSPKQVKVAAPLKSGGVANVPETSEFLKPTESVFPGIKTKAVADVPLPSIALNPMLSRMTREQAAKELQTESESQTWAVARPNFAPDKNLKTAEEIFTSKSYQPRVIDAESLQTAINPKSSSLTKEFIKPSASSSGGKTPVENKVSATAFGGYPPAPEKVNFPSPEKPKPKRPVPPKFPKGNEEVLPEKRKIEDEPQPASIFSMYKRNIPKMVVYGSGFGTMEGESFEQTTFGKRTVTTVTPKSKMKAGARTLTTPEQFFGSKSSMLRPITIPRRMTPMEDVGIQSWVG